MTKEEAKLEIESLSEVINRHNDLYYIKSNPEISDYDFDMLLEKLQRLEKQLTKLYLRENFNTLAT